jgi:hypothetical protein
VTPAIVVSSLTAVTSVLTGLLFWAALAWSEATPPGAGEEEAEPCVRPVPALQASSNSVTYARVRFSVPEGTKVAWFYVEGGMPVYPATRLDAPARHKLKVGSSYRVMLSAIPDHPGVDLDSLLEVAPSTLKTATFLAGNSVLVEITDEEIRAVCDKQTLVKVIYLPDRGRNGEAPATTPEVISAVGRPWADVVLGAERLGTILLVVRLGE